MTSNSPELYRLLTEMATLIEQNSEPDPQLYILFFQQPELAFKLIDIINNLEEKLDEGLSVYSACIFALDICVAQLQGAAESNKISAKTLIQLMDHLAQLINSQKHTLSFWLPILNSFYESHVELTEDLKNAYYDLASEEEELINEDESLSHLDAIRDLIHELSDLSVFDIAENFFAQSYAMPADFFADLLVDLYNIDEGGDIALLILLHPKADVREIAIETMGQVMDIVTLTSISLSRLQTVKYWYPDNYHPLFDSWIKIQRKKGVVFAPEPEPGHSTIRATEVDGTGSQGIFLHIGSGRKNRLCGLLLKYDLGLKDAWITPAISSKDVKDYYKQAFDENVTLREVDLSYFTMIVEHFLAVTVEHGEIPSVHFLEIQELLGIRLRPQKLDMDYLFEQLGVQITPFTQETINESLQRSKSWLKSKSFTESWYLENPIIDKIVNHNSSFVDGIRVCRMKEAMDAVFSEEMELHRVKWQFHFLWVALWMKAKEKRNEKIWRDSFLIAYSIHEGVPLREIPVMQEICRQTVINSVETMQERRTHLSQE
ncbi:hypothetical protein [Legionella longbeachae]|uniref:Uncharacterized protein n=1 Tax=Legionella longbeachae serogroup 1 (strain NSW150) TaxID=661367 RepID=D3HNS9_LEGLN|nr:hypothetical protein [Legionella longbeachae]VEE01068.1 Uncharacterised protein [Legionella oakridgensis]HBD7398490.1 hypothetical protein [Legionella pneumophila]ARB92550.1 hypothetical protein A6J40_10365 [Legionella longbeachae]ARM34274.1 hypothetical protein B0B39_12360 [Legionella longbeachae]EEZ96461.1 conserved hypothetical protein [Legionella longbeachae D-4968]